MHTVQFTAGPRSRIGWTWFPMQMCVDVFSYLAVSRFLVKSGGVSCVVESVHVEMESPDENIRKLIYWFFLEFALEETGIAVSMSYIQMADIIMDNILLH